MFYHHTYCACFALYTKVSYIKLQPNPMLPLCPGIQQHQNRDHCTLCGREVAPDLPKKVSLTSVRCRQPNGSHWICTCYFKLELQLRRSMSGFLAQGFLWASSSHLLAFLCQFCHFHPSSLLPLQKALPVPGDCS